MAHTKTFSHCFVLSFKDSLVVFTDSTFAPYTLKIAECVDWFSGVVGYRWIKGLTELTAEL